MPQMKSENGVTYVNHESVPVEFIQYTGNIKEVADFLMQHKVPHGNQVAKNDYGNPFLCVADSYRDVDEESPNEGDYFIIFPNKKVILYTPGEFEACFKIR